MLTGHVDGIDRTGIDGWAADSADLNAVVEVTIFINGHAYAHLACNEFRDDLRRTGNHGAGKHGFRYAFPVRLLEDIEYRVSVVFRATGETLPHGFKLLPVAKAHRDVKPLLVTAPARSGTTAFMGLLANSPNICVAKVHPYEVRMLTYYWTAYRTLAAMGDREHSTDPDKLLENPHFVGSNPFSSKEYQSAFDDPRMFHEMFSGVLPDTLAVAFRKIISSYYEKLAEDQKKTEVSYFAEKRLNLAPGVRRFGQALFGSIKDIVLIRDPRDILASRLFYFGVNPDAAIEEISIDCNDLLQAKRDSDPSALFVSYEGMVTDPQVVAKQVADFLGVELSVAGYDAEAAGRFQEHATSGSPRASIGRWRRDLSNEQKAHCNGVWREFLTAFSYSDDAPPPRQISVLNA